jgi:hypothetical protein
MRYAIRQLRRRRLDSLVVVRQPRAVDPDLVSIASQTAVHRCRRGSAALGPHGDEVLRGPNAPELGFGQAGGAVHGGSECGREYGIGNGRQGLTLLAHVTRQPRADTVRLSERDAFGTHQ